MVEVVDLQMRYKLTRCMAQALYLLLSNKVVTPKMLEVDVLSSIGAKTPLTTDSKVLMHRVRRRLTGTNIDIKSQRNLGYWLDNASRDRIMSDVGDEQMSLPFDAPLAASDSESESLAA